MSEEDNEPLDGLTSKAGFRVRFRQIASKLIDIPDDAERLDKELDEVPELSLIFDNKLL